MKLAAAQGEQTAARRRMPRRLVSPSSGSAWVAASSAARPLAGLTGGSLTFSNNLGGPRGR